jgi:hypothetical protein
MKNTVNHLNLFLTFIVVFISNSNVRAQCTGGTFGGTIGAFTTVYQTKNVTSSRYYEFVAETGCKTYDFSFCSGGGSAAYDTQITILDNSGIYVGFPGYNDDACGTQSEILGWLAPAAGTYRLYITEYNCSGDFNAGVIAFKENGPVLSAGGDYTLQSDASSATDPTCVELTANTGGQTGCAWDSNSTLDFNADFSYDFTVNLGTSDGGADGMAFVIQNDPAGICACGNSGGGFAAEGIANSLIVEIDTYLNTEDRDDGALMTAQGVTCGAGVDPDHLDIWLNGVVNPGGGCPNAGYPTDRAIPDATPLMNGGALYNVENGNDHILRVDWNSGTGTFTASLMNLALSTTYGTVSIGSGDFDPMTVFGTLNPFFGFTAATGGLSNQHVFCNPATLLPVEMTTFDVACAITSTELKWETSSERNNDFFTILRSTDGVNFEKIGTVNGSGNSAGVSEYFFQDNNRPNQQCYYTISQTDFDGTEKKCGFVRVVECLSENSVSIYPNPLKSGEKLSIGIDTNSNLIVDVFDLRGKKVYSKVLNDSDSKDIYPNLTSGIYQVVIKSIKGNTLNSTKLVVLD